jgi:hypothetical protein
MGSTALGKNWPGVGAGRLAFGVFSGCIAVPPTPAVQPIFSDSTDFHHYNATGGNLGKFVESNDSTADPTGFRDLVESNDPTTRSHQIPPDPTVFHQYHAS